MDEARDKKAGVKPVSDKDHPPAGADVSVPPQDTARKGESMQGGATGGGSGTPVTRTPAENARTAEARTDAQAENPRAATRSGDDDPTG